MAVTWGNVKDTVGLQTWHAMVCGPPGTPGVLMWARGQSHCWWASPGKAPLLHLTSALAKA